jgi:nicotinamide mononucleotide adenylyltransferase
MCCIMGTESLHRLDKNSSLHVPYQRIGMVARWQPVHSGHAVVLRALCQSASQALIGIGSSNTLDYRCPFRLEETSEMISLVLAQHNNYTLIPVPDLHDGPRWRQLILHLFGPLDCFVTANPYVASLLSADYRIIHPMEIIPSEDRMPIDGSLVRREMAQGQGWLDMVPPQIAEYINTRRLDERFRREFGLQTLALEMIVESAQSVTKDNE